MADYENKSTPEVVGLVKQGDSEAMYEMAWRIDMLPPEEDNPVGRCAWQDYWFEKAANAGHVFARSRLARSLRDRALDAEYRQQAMDLFQRLAEDYDAGRLTDDDHKNHGVLAKLWLGVMLCEGFHTKRDPEKGVGLISSAKSLTNGFRNAGFETLFELGCLYSDGFVQPGEEPSIADVEQAIEYLETAIKRFDKEQGNPKALEIAESLLRIQEDRARAKRTLKSTLGSESTHLPQEEVDERRKQILGLSFESRQRLEADKSALARLRQRLALEGL